MEQSSYGVRVSVYRDHLTCQHYMKNRGTPPRNEGDRGSVGLTRKAVAKIRRGVAYLEAQGPTWFVTLTYPNQLPDGRVHRPGDIIQVVDDKDAKRHLSMWLRRVKRFYPQFLYVWVAEVQPKRLVERGERAVHFHLVTNMPLPLEWLNRTWSEVVGRGPAYPNQQRVRKSAGAYIAKYMTKGRAVEDLSPMEYALAYIKGNRYGMDQRVNAQLKLQHWADFPAGNWCEIAKHLTPSDVPFSLNSDANFLGIWWGFSYLKGNGNARNHDCESGFLTERGGPVHRGQGEMDSAIHEGPSLLGREGRGSNQV